MIYTIGHKENYLKAIAQEGVIYKTGKIPVGDSECPDGYPGGYAFHTFEDAQRGLQEEDKHNKWTIFGLDAQWGIDTQQATDGWWHNLLKDAPIIVLG